MDRPCAASCASMFLRTPPAWVSVSPYRSGEPAAASAFTIGGVVPLIQIDARFAGMMTLADIGDVALPTNFTAPGEPGCCAPAPIGASAAAPASTAIATTRDPIASFAFAFVASSLGEFARGLSVPLETEPDLKLHRPGEPADRCDLPERRRAERGHRAVEERVVEQVQH